MTCTMHRPPTLDPGDVADANELLDRLELIIQRLSEGTLSPSCVDAVLFLRHELQQAARGSVQSAGA